MANQIDYAWAAGFFDGEGCVNLHVGQGRYVTLTVIVVQKDLRPIDKFKSVFGATEKISITHRVNRRHVYYRLQLSGQRAADALTLMLPYLVLKREVAIVALDLQESVKRYDAKQRKAGLPDAEMQYRRSLVDKAKWLNSGRWAAATTEPNGSPVTAGCDSLDCSDGKAAEVAEMPTRSTVQ